MPHFMVIITERHHFIKHIREPHSQLRMGVMPGVFLMMKLQLLSGVTFGAFAIFAEPFGKPPCAGG